MSVCACWAMAARRASISLDKRSLPGLSLMTASGAGWSSGGAAGFGAGAVAACFACGGSGAVVRAGAATASPD